MQTCTPPTERKAAGLCTSLIHLLLHSHSGDSTPSNPDYRTRFLISSLNPFACWFRLFTTNSCNPETKGHISGESLRWVEQRTTTIGNVCKLQSLGGSCEYRRRSSNCHSYKTLQQTLMLLGFSSPLFDCRVWNDTVGWCFDKLVMSLPCGDVQTLREKGIVGRIIIQIATGSCSQEHQPSCLFWSLP